MNNKFIRGAVGFAAVSALHYLVEWLLPDAISIAVPSFLTVARLDRLAFCYEWCKNGCGRD